MWNNDLEESKYGVDNDLLFVMARIKIFLKKNMQNEFEVWGESLHYREDWQGSVYMKDCVALLCTSPASFFEIRSDCFLEYSFSFFMGC